MKKSKMMIAIATLMLVTACGTVRGVASDTYGATKFVARQIAGE